MSNLKISGVLVVTKVSCFEHQYWAAQVSIINVASHKNIIV